MRRRSRSAAPTGVWPGSCTRTSTPATARPQRPQFYRDFAGQAGTGPDPYASDAGFADLADADDLLAGLIGRAGTRGGARRMRMRGGDLRGRVALDFLEAVNGTTK